MNVNQAKVLAAKPDKAQVRQVYSREGRLVRASLRVARHIREVLEETGRSDTRFITGLFIPDELVLAGRSNAFAGSGRREHVVPNRVVVLECVRRISEGASDDEIAQVIRDNVRIVLITSEECERLDRRDQHGLKQKMLDNWKFGDNIYARLDAAGIAWTSEPDKSESTLPASSAR